MLKSEGTERKASTRGMQRQADVSQQKKKPTALVLSNRFDAKKKALRKHKGCYGHWDTKSQDAQFLNTERKEQREKLKTNGFTLAKFDEHFENKHSKSSILCKVRIVIMIREETKEDMALYLTFRGYPSTLPCPRMSVTYLSDIPILSYKRESY